MPKTGNDKNQLNLVWLLDDEFSSKQIDKIRSLLNQNKCELVVSNTTAYRQDYKKYAPQAKGILVQVGFELGEQDLKGFTSCQIITVTGIGLNDLDVEAATRMGIVVTNVPDFCTEEVAEHVLALILALNRRLPEYQTMTRNGRWQAIAIGPMRRLKGQRIGILGFGRIGKAVAEKAKSLGMQIIACDAGLPRPAIDQCGVKSVSMDELFRTADFISVHVPLTASTSNLVDAVRLNQMKKTACLINTSRGRTVDETALIDALRNKVIAGAGLDVLSAEPPDPKNPLLNMPNVIVSPHAAFISDESLDYLCSIAVKAICDQFETRRPDNIVNPGLLKPEK